MPNWFRRYEEHDGLIYYSYSPLKIFEIFFKLNYFNLIKSLKFIIVIIQNTFNWTIYDNDTNTRLTQSDNVFSASNRDLFWIIFGLKNIIRVFKFTHLFVLEVHLITQYAYGLFCEIFCYIFTCYLPRERKALWSFIRY